MSPPPTWPGVEPSPGDVTVEVELIVIEVGIGRGTIGTDWVRATLIPDGYE